MAPWRCWNQVDRPVLRADGPETEAVLARSHATAFDADHAGLTVGLWLEFRNEFNTSVRASPLMPISTAASVQATWAVADDP